MNNLQYIVNQTRTKETLFDIVTDIPEPKDHKIMFKDILEYGYISNEKSQVLLESEANKQLPNLVYVEKEKVIVKTNTLKGFDVLTENDCLNLSFPTSTTRRGRITKWKAPALLAGNDLLYSLKNYNVRILTQIELERLQGFPDGYTSILTRNKAASLLGDGWTLPMIEHIISFMDKKEYKINESCTVNYKRILINKKNESKKFKNRK